MHYIQDELGEMMNLENINIKNYVVVNDELIEVSPELILLSKKLSELKDNKCIYWNYIKIIIQKIW